MSEESAGEQRTFCATHPDVETALRCGRCGKPICPRCLVMTPVGARCRDCARLRPSPIFVVSPTQYLLAAAAAFAAAAACGLALSLLPGFGVFFLIFLGGGVGYVVGEATTRSVNRKRGLGLAIIAGAAAAAAVLVFPTLWRALFAAGPLLAAGPVGPALLIRALLAAMLEPWRLLAAIFAVAVAVGRTRWV